MGRAESVVALMQSEGHQPVRACILRQYAAFVPSCFLIAHYCWLCLPLSIPLPLPGRNYVAVLPWGGAALIREVN